MKFSVAALAFAAGASASYPVASEPAAYPVSSASESAAVSSASESASASYPASSASASLPVVSSSASAPASYPAVSSSVSASAATSFPAGNATSATQYTTEVVTSYETYCPGPTQITYGTNTYTVTEVCLSTNSTKDSTTNKTLGHHLDHH